MKPVGCRVDAGGLKLLLLCFSCDFPWETAARGATPGWPSLAPRRLTLPDQSCYDLGGLKLYGKYDAGDESGSVGAMLSF